MLSWPEELHKLTEAAKNLAQLAKSATGALERHQLEKLIGALQYIYFYESGVVADLEKIVAPQRTSARLDSRRIGSFDSAEKRVSQAVQRLLDAPELGPLLIGIPLRQSLESIAYGKRSVRREVQSFIAEMRAEGKADRATAARLLQLIAELNLAIRTAEAALIEAAEART